MSGEESTPRGAHCAECGDWYEADGKTAGVTGGRFICKHCIGEPVVFVGECLDCEFTYRRSGRSSNRYAVKQRVQQENNNHETEKNAFEDESHETVWREVEPTDEERENPVQANQTQKELVTDGGTPRDQHETPDGWVREEIVAGMDTVGISDHFDEFLGLGSAYKCRRCEHFIPIDALDDDDATCPRCERSGMIGTVIMGRQDVTAMYPDGWFDGEDDALFTDGGTPPSEQDSEMVRCRCLDTPNCGETFVAYPSAARWCPYCREMAEIINEDHPAVPDDAPALSDPELVTDGGGAKPTVNESVQQFVDRYVTVSEDAGPESIAGLYEEYGRVLTDVQRERWKWHLLEALPEEIERNGDTLYGIEVSLDGE